MPRVTRISTQRDHGALTTRKVLLGRVTQAVEELADAHPYSELSRRLVAEHCALPYLLVCSHFASIEALIAETCLYRLRESPLVIEFGDTPRQRMVSQFHQLIMLMSCQPRYGSACVRAIMSGQPSVQPIRRDIDDEVHRHVSAALGSGAWPEVVAALHMALLGAVVQAASTGASLTAVSDRLGHLADLLLADGANHH